MPIKPGDTVRVKGWGAIACYFKGFKTYWTEESIEEDENGDPIFVNAEEIEDFDRAIVVMVGDNAKHTVDFEDLILLDETDYCHVCGQIGCGHDGLDRG